jgi:S1-C subfamily serine protease
LKRVDGGYNHHLCESVLFRFEKEQTRRKKKKRKKEGMFDNVFSLLIQKAGHTETEPWIRRNMTSIGTGTLIQYKNEKMILTNEHVIRHSTYICTPSHGRKTLRVRFYSKVHDLALLIPDDKSAFDSIDAFELSNNIIVTPGDSIHIVGFPRNTGATKPCENAMSSCGTISRLVSFDYNQTELNMIYQLVAATDFGSSGSPVISTYGRDRRLVGIGSYRLEDKANNAQDVCYMIPIPIINHFMETFMKTRTSNNGNGLCNLGITISLSHNQMLRTFYLGHNNTSDIGVLVTNSEHPKLQSGDFIMAINDHSISKSGMTWDTHLSGNVPHWYIIKMMHPHDIVSLQIIRDKKPMEIFIPLECTLLQNDTVKYIRFESMIFTQKHSYENIKLSEFIHSEKMQGYELGAGMSLVKFNDVHMFDIDILKQKLSDINSLIKLQFSTGDIVVITDSHNIQLESNF